MEHARVWLGRVAQGHEPEHERFVAWLRSDEAASQYARYLLTGYALVQHGNLLKVTMRAEEPLSFIRFLRNPRMWPACWAFVAAGRADQDDAAEGGQVRVSWRWAQGSGEGQSRQEAPGEPE